MKTYIFTVAVILVLFNYAQAQTTSNGEITGEQGKAILMEIPTGVYRIELTKNGGVVREAVIFERDAKKYALLALNLEDKIGEYKLIFHGLEISEQEFTLLRGKYKTSKSRSWNTPPPLKRVAAERVARERRAMEEAYKNRAVSPFWADSKAYGFGLPLKRCCTGKNISSQFGQIRIGTKRGSVPRHHRGVDLRAPQGTPVYSVANGRVAYAGNHLLDGKITIIDHGAGIFSLYLHQSLINVSVGDFVAKGKLIGRVGKTGIASGPNLHLEIRINGTRVSPLNFIELFQ